MKLEIEVSEKDLLDFGKQAIEQEIQESLKRLRLRSAFSQLSQEIRSTWSVADYDKEVAMARKEAWDIYKENVGL